MLRNILGAMLAGAAMLAATAPAAAEDIVIHAGRLFDGVSKTERTQVSILIHDDRIAAVQPGFVTPAAGARLIDLSQQTVLPGLIDCHMHLAAPDLRPPVTALVNAVPDLTLMSANAARKTLLSGFTSARNVGGWMGIDLGLMRAIQRGDVPGPRLWASGNLISPTGGHGDRTSEYDPEITHPRWNDGLADGADAVRHAVRLQHKYGANVIKILPSGGVATFGDDPARQLMTDEEIKAAVETAHALGLKIAAHAIGLAPIDAAVKAGIDSIEHGTYSDAETFKLMKAHGTVLVPTLYVYTLVMRSAAEAPGNINPDAEGKMRKIIGLSGTMFNAAYKAGVKMAFGSDTAGTGTSLWGLKADSVVTANEFALMVKNGMTPADALMTATANAAELIGDSADIGSIQPGRYADIIAVPGDPLADIGTMAHVSFVMQGGQVYRDR